MQMHCAVVKTKETGSFRLQGSPIRRGYRSAKKMVASVFSKCDENKKTWSLLALLNNAIRDQVQVRHIARFGEEERERVGESRKVERRGGEWEGCS